MTRRSLLATVAVVLGTGSLASCSDDPEGDGTGEGSAAGPGGPDPDDRSLAVDADWHMPAEEDPHERTWMCWPSSSEVWGSDLAAVQDNIIDLAVAISAFEPVTMLARAEELQALVEILGDGIEVVEAPVDDLWARDTLPNFVVVTAADGSTTLAASHATFNGWGDKQIHGGDTQLAELVAARLGIELIDSGLVGEGGAIEVDGAGTVLAAEGCWVNDNRNPGWTRDEIEAAILDMVGGERMIWVDGLAGFDITDGHIDTLARFASPTVIVVDSPAFDDPDDPWVAVAATTRELVGRARTADDEPYEVVEVVQPAEIRSTGDDFLATYLNYYVCNGAVIAPEFGDPAGDAVARAVLEELFPGRQVIMIAIDGLAAGGGGIHCATQQQPQLSGGSVSSAGATEGTGDASP